MYRNRMSLPASPPQEKTWGSVLAALLLVLAEYLRSILKEGGYFCLQCNWHRVKSRNRGLDGCSPCLCSQEEMESESQALKISRMPPATNFLQRRSPLKVPVPSQTAPPAGVQMFLQVCLWRTLHVETATFSCLVPWLSRTFLALPLLSDLCFQKPYSLKWGCSVQPVSKSLSSNFLDISEETVILLDCRV